MARATMHTCHPRTVRVCLFCAMDDVLRVYRVCTNQCMLTWFCNLDFADGPVCIQRRQNSLKSLQP